jgi:hypothetical protein
METLQLELTVMGLQYQEFAESVGGRCTDRGASGAVDLNLALRAGKLLACRAGHCRAISVHRCLIASRANVFVRIPETFSSCTQSFVLTNSGNLSTILSVSSSVSGETRTPFDLQRLRALSTSQSTPRIVQDFKACWCASIYGNRKLRSVRKHIRTSAHISQLIDQPQPRVSDVWYFARESKFSFSL